MKKQFLAIPYDILAIQGLTATEKMLLGRIAGFDEYFESSEKCAKLFALKKDTIAKAKRHLVELEYITETANTGRGKKYVANPIWKRKKAQKQQEEEPDAAQATSSVPSAKEIGLKGSSPEPTGGKQPKFEKRYSEYLRAYDRGLTFLRQHHIGVSDKASLQSDFAALVDTFSEYPAEDVTNMILTYLDYLDSPQYEYQVRKNKFCPQILQQRDLYRKFTAVRNFKNSKDRQYDPSKTLTQ